MPPTEAIDVCAPVTWPRDLTELVDQLSAETTSVDNSTDDVTALRLPVDADDRVGELLVGHSLRAYHATRLLDHEIELITAGGLRTFSKSLFEERIHAASGHNEISLTQRDLLLGTYMHAKYPAAAKQRDGLLFMLVGDHDFAGEDPRSARKFLESWGGEGIFRATEDVEMHALLKRLGRPTIVAAAAPVPVPSDRSRCAPALADILVGIARGMRVSAVLTLRHDILPTSIIGLWQPGHPAYDRYAALPRD